MDREIGTGAEIARRLGDSRERERQWASDPRYGFPQCLGRIGRVKVWLWPEGSWCADRRVRGGPSCQD
jgi:hypothetical protein